jgi:hypothetical protein
MAIIYNPNGPDIQAGGQVNPQSGVVIDNSTGQVSTTSAAPAQALPQAQTLPAFDLSSLAQPPLLYGVAILAALAGYWYWKRQEGDRD